MAVADFVYGFGKVVAGAVAAKTKEIVYQVLGSPGFEEDGSGDQTAEKQVGYTGLGLVGWPPPPQKLDGTVFDADVVYVKQGDELVPIAWRDLRLNRCFPAGIKQGTIALAGYGGGFYSLDLTPASSGSQKANIHVLYCPFDFDSNGVPQKAHVITLDPATNSMGMIHADGFAIMLDGDNGITMRASTTTWFNMKAGEITLVADKITAQGNVALGAQPLAAAPLLAGPVAPARPSVFLSIA